MKKIVLFDMDGTLTPARKQMQWSMVTSLAKLQKAGYEIGIVTGSDMDYLMQQCNAMFDISPVDFTSIHFMPCNGTKYYRYQSGKSSPVTVYENDMKSQIGLKSWQNLIQILCNLQACVTNIYCNIPLSGHFINYRGSMVNWCPIGRQADFTDRSRWEKEESDKNIRIKFKDMLESALKAKEIDSVVVKLGGETSFDIYPSGWDKTFAFKAFKDYDEIYFVGDRCEPSGNDFEAYVLAGPNGFKTTGPEKTENIIKNILSEN